MNSQILDNKFASEYVVNKNGNQLPIPTVSSWCGLDEQIMDEMYDKIKKAGEITYSDLVIVGWCYKSDDESYRERQALLALESLGKVIRKQTLLWFLDELWSLP